MLKLARFLQIVYSIYKALKGFNTNALQIYKFIAIATLLFASQIDCHQNRGSATTSCWTVTGNWLQDLVTWSGSEVLASSLRVLLRQYFYKISFTGPSQLRQSHFSCRCHPIPRLPQGVLIVMHKLSGVCLALQPTPSRSCFISTGA